MLQRLSSIPMKREDPQRLFHAHADPPDGLAICPLFFAVVSEILGPKSAGLGVRSCGEGTEEGCP